MSTQTGKTIDVLLPAIQMPGVMPVVRKYRRSEVMMVTETRKVIKNKGRWDNYQKIRQRWLDAEVEHGMKVITFFDFEYIPVEKKIEVLNEVSGAVILSRDRAENMCVVMTMDKYFSMVPVNPNPKRQPRMLRHEGVLYREVV